ALPARRAGALDRRPGRALLPRAAVSRAAHPERLLPEDHAAAARGLPPVPGLDLTRRVLRFYFSLSRKKATVAGHACSVALRFAPSLPDCCLRKPWPAPSKTFGV